MEKQTFTAIILSYLRPQNIERICKTLLSLDDIGRVVVSNNNPEVNLEEYITLKDPRLSIITQNKKSGPFKRFEIAHELSGEYFLSIDDDLFLNKTQISSLMKQLLHDQSAPHGFWGQSYTRRFFWLRIGDDVIINKIQKVDILNRSYFFTKSHLQEMFSLMQQAGINTEEIGPSDDILISFSGNQKPFIHDIGDYSDCPTSNVKGVAQWLDNTFHDKRVNVLKKILQIKKFDH